MEILSSLRTQVGQLFEGGKSVCLWFSGGSDSRLLLEVMIETGKPFGVLRFEEGWDRNQKRQTDAVILQHNLQAFSYPPVGSLLVAKDGDIALISAYPVDASGNVAILGRDLVDNPKRCAFDIDLEIARDAAAAPIEFDVHCWGTREEDRHWIADEQPLARGERWKVGEKEFVAPLWEWSRENVIEALKTYGIEPPVHDTGDIRSCAKCLAGTGPVLCPKTGTEIASQVWDGAANLELVRSML